MGFGNLLFQVALARFWFGRKGNWAIAANHINFLKVLQPSTEAVSGTAVN
jgi:hypothetical protein